MQFHANNYHFPYYQQTNNGRATVPWADCHGKAEAGKRNYWMSLDQTTAHILTIVGNKNCVCFYVCPQC